MRKKLRHLLIFAAGLFGGLLLAQCFVVLAARSGGSFGGETFTLLAFPLLIGASYAIGRDGRRMGDYDHGYRQGFAKGQNDRAAGG